MNKELDNLFYNIKNTIFNIINEKNIDIELLSFDLGIDSTTFISNFSKRINDFTFYLQTLSLVENWEG